MRPDRRRAKGGSRLVATGALLALGCLVSRGAAQEPRGLEAGPELTSTLARPVFAGGGMALGLRVGGSARVVVAAMPGVADRRLAGRGELLGQLMLTPGRVHGVGVYGLGGLAGQLGRRKAGWLVLGLGIEGSPGRPGGWHIEAGIGGGMRISAGWRWRWLRTASAASP